MGSLYEVSVYFFLYESLINMLELKSFRFSLGQIFLTCMLYKVKIILDNHNVYCIQ